jgi:hypothetical protein
MRAAWYEKQGPAREALTVGENSPDHMCASTTSSLKQHKADPTCCSLNQHGHLRIKQRQRKPVRTMFFSVISS